MGAQNPNRIADGKQLMILAVTEGEVGVGDFMIYHFDQDALSSTIRMCR